MTQSPALTVVEYTLMVYRRTWRGSVMVSLLSPVAFLAAMGLGLGSLVRNGGTVAGTSYLHYIAPGLLGAAAMQTAVGETTYPIISRAHWQQVYDAMLSTPLRIRDLVHGEALWLTLRLLMGAAAAMVAMALFGVVRSPEALLAVPVAAATGLAFGMPVMAFSVTRRRDSGFAAITRFVILPLYLLGGTFFPIDELPRLFQVVAWATPLTHGVALARALVLGSASLVDACVHVAVLVAYIAAGMAAAYRTYPLRLAR